jgi:hypothetical protein
MQKKRTLSNDFNLFYQNGSAERTVVFRPSVRIVRSDLISISERQNGPRVRDRVRTRLYADGGSPRFEDFWPEKFCSLVEIGGEL